MFRFGVAGILVAFTAYPAAAQTCTHSQNNGTAIFSFLEGAATLDIRLGEAQIAARRFRCGPTACTLTEDLEARGGTLHHVVQYFPDRSEVIYSVSHEDYPARSTIQIFPVTCEPR